MRQIYVLLTVFALGVTPAFADDDVKREVEVVTGADCTMVSHKGEELCGLTLDELKRVLATNLTLESKNKLLYLEHQKTSLLEGQQVDFRKQLEALSANEKLLIDHNNKLTQDLIKLDKKYQEERVKPRWGNPLAWTAAAVSTSLLVGFVVRDALD